jgi:hypothetical protein
LTFTVGKNSPPVDLFTVYSLNKTHDYLTVFDFGEHSSEQAVYPAIRDICSGDLHGKLVKVPCNAEEVVIAEYGPKWKIDFPSSEYNYLEVFLDPILYNYLFRRSIFDDLKITPEANSSRLLFFIRNK